MNLAVDWSNRRRLLRETAFCGDPAGEAEDAPQAPRGKRSLVRKSTAVFNRANQKNRQNSQNEIYRFPFTINK
jgi:hypothetical protein